MLNKQTTLSLSILLLGFMLGMSAPAGAATITVTASAPDVLNGADGSCALREAIQNINDGATTFADCLPTGVYGTADTITLPAGTYTTLIPGFDTVNAKGGMDMRKSVTLNGGGIFCRNGSLTIDNTTISGNTSNGPQGGGGIYTQSCTALIVRNNSLIDNNTATVGGGGGIQSNAATATITNATISNNKATATSGKGGGVSNTGAASTMTITSSTIMNNISNFRAGGIMSNTGSTLTIDDSIGTGSTISGNTITGAPGSAFGGGIATSGTLTSTNSTITDNSAPVGGGGLWSSGGVALTLNNTIIAKSAGGGQTGGDCFLSGVVPVALNSLDSDGSCGVGALSNKNPLLGPLAANGGPIPTKTHTLLTGSPALDAGDVATCLNAPVNNKDQRGLPRPQGTGCDIGAVEANHQPQPTAPTIINTGLAVTSQVTHHDPDTVNPGNTWVYTVQTTPTNGVASVDVNGLATYTPNGGWLGPDTFVIKVQDNGVLPLSGTATVIVTGSNKPPVPTAPAITTNEDTADTSQIAPNDPNVGDTHTYAVTTPSANGNVVVNAAGLATYTPNLNFNGVDSFIVKVTVNAVVVRIGGGGCVISPSTSFDPTMLLMLLISGVYLVRKQGHAD